MNKAKKASHKKKTETNRGSTIKSARQKRIEAKSMCIVLLSIFAVSVLFRYVMSVATLNMPTVYIDEGLYINIARSLFHDGQVMYRDQPISYVYLLYPIALLPLFLLPPSVSLYRAVQFYNAVLISSSVFPAYLLGRKMHLRMDRSIILAILTLLIPEFALSSFLTAESLYYPMMMWVFVLTATICDTEDGRELRKSYLALGILSGLVFFAKPICIIFPCCFLIIDFFMNLHEREGKKACYSFCTLAIVGIVVAVGYIIYDLLFGKTTVLNLYEKQISETDLSSVPIMIQGFFYHIIALAFSCGGAFILLPLACRKSFSQKQQRLMTVSIVGCLASIIGVAIMVVPYRYTGSGFTCPVHLRYLAFFFPLLIAFLLSLELPSQKLGKGTLAFLILVTACTIFPSAFHFFNEQAGIFDAPALNAFYYSRINMGVGILLLVLSVGAFAYMTVLSVKKGWQEKIRVIACSILAVFFCVNGACTYFARRTDSKSIEQEATMIAQFLANEPDALIVTTNLYDDFRTFHIDSHLWKPVQMVVMNDMLLNCTRTGGVYEPWVPYVQAPNTFNNATVNTDTLVFDLTTSDYVEFTDSVETTQVGHYLIAKITPGEPFLKSAIGSMDGYTLHHEDVGSLLIYDTGMLDCGSVSLNIKMRSKDGSPCTVTFSCCAESTEVTVTDTIQAYSVSLPIKECEFFHFTISCSEDIVIEEYSTE